MVHNYDCEAIYGTNLHSAARANFVGPVHQYRINNPPDRSSTYCIPLGIARFHDKSPPKPTPSSTTQGGQSSSKTQKKGISIPQLQARYVQRDKKIGAGGAAEVWLANLRDPSRPSRSVVVKVPLQSSLAQSSFGTANAQREAQMAFQLQHPFLVKFYGTVSGDEFGDFGLVFEYCEKGDLFEYMHPPMGSEPHFSLNHRLQIAFDIIRALVYLHSQTPPIIHRDVKSPNILLTNESGKLADLGLATFFTTLVSTGASRTRSGGSNRTTNAGGTPSWQAPETFGLGGKKRATPKADVFSFGVLLWELLTLEIPWEGETESDIKEGVKEGRRPEVPDEPVFPQSYIDLMTHCWKPKPADRPTSLEVLQKLVEIRNEMFDAHSFRIWDHSNFQHSCSIREDRWVNHRSVENLHYLKLSHQCLPNEEQAVLNLLSAEVYRTWEVLELNANYSPLCFGRWTQWTDTFPSLQSGNIYTKKFSEGLTPAQTHEKEEVMRLLHPNVWKNESGQEAILAWIGVSSEDRCDTCCGKGFHDFSGLDVGFFGRGIYSTLHPHYAASYGAKEFDKNAVPANYSFLVLVLVTLGNSYPLTRAVDCRPGSQYCNFWDSRGEGKSLKAQFNSHIAPIEASRGYQLPGHVSEADFVEIVVSEPNQILPLYKFKLVRRDII